MQCIFPWNDHKNGCSEFLSPHGDVRVMNVAEVVSTSNGWVNNSWEGKRRCIDSVISKRRIHERRRSDYYSNSKPAWCQNVSADVDALKLCLDRSFDLIEEHYMDDNVLKKFILICTDGTSTNIGYSNSLFTSLLEEHSVFTSFWCIAYQLELVTKKSVGKGLLNNIKDV